MWQIQGAREAGRCAEGERGRKLNGNMMNRRWMKESEEMSVRVCGGGEEESLSSEGDSGWKDWAAAGANPFPHTVHALVKEHHPLLGNIEHKYGCSSWLLGLPVALFFSSALIHLDYWAGNSSSVTHIYSFYSHTSSFISATRLLAFNLSPPHFRPSVQSAWAPALRRPSPHVSHSIMLKFVAIGREWWQTGGPQGQTCSEDLIYVKWCSKKHFPLRKTDSEFLKKLDFFFLFLCSHQELHITFSWFFGL